MITSKTALPKLFDPARLISVLAAVLVGVLALLAFVLSYSSLHHVAASNGVGEWLAYAWPLLLDFAMVVFSLAILRANLRGEPARYPWALTIAFAGLAVVANILDAAPLGVPPVIVAGAVKALAPIALVLAFELLMTMIRAEVKRAGTAVTLVDLAHQVGEARAELDRTRTAIRVEAEALAARKRAEVQPGALPRKSTKKRTAAHVSQPTAEDYQQAARLKAEGLSWSQVAGELGKSVTTVKRWAAQADMPGHVAQPVLSANGHAGEVAL
jgi:ribosome-binding protein aMBF1 (putative translation factor)